MHTSRFLQSAISIFALLNRCRLADATPLGQSPDGAGGSLDARTSCENPCGYYSQLCCASGETCITDDNSQAVCSSSGSSGDSGGGKGDGSWEYYSSTWVVTETDAQTHSSVWSSWITKPTSTGSGSGSCRSDIGETECGSECCSASDICNEDKKCVLAATTSIWATDTGTATPPVRPTDSNTVTETATSTQGFETPVTTDGSPALGVDAPEDDGGLSGGAIAGIVIGTLAGVFLLFLLCLCLCARGLLHSMLACLGCGKRRRREETYVEDRYSHHSHRPGRTWFGTTKPHGSAHGGEKKSAWSRLATIGIIFGAIALCLGLKRKGDHDEKSSDYTYPSYYSYYTSNTSESSDRRTRRSRRSGRSRSRA